MKNKKPAIWFTSILTLLLAFTLAVWPSFRTAAQKKDKPATTTDKSKNNDANRKSTTGGTSGKISPIDQETLNNAMKEVDKAMEQLKKEDWPKIQAEISRAIKELDTEKISREVNAALKEVDMEKIRMDIKQAMKEIDLAQISEEVRKAMKSIDISEMQRELAEVQKKTGKEISLEMEKLQKELANIHIDIKKEMEKANLDMQKAKAHLQLMKEGLQLLEEDGLIKKNEKVNIEMKNGILFLNGKEQSKEVSEKYRKYFGSQMGPNRNHDRGGNNNDDDNTVK